MVDDPKSTVPPHTTISAAQAPILYFDNSPSIGTQSGVVAITLTAFVNLPTVEGGVENFVNVVGFLRCNLEAAAKLRDDLDKVLLLARPVDIAIAN